MPPIKPPVEVIEPRQGTWLNNPSWGSTYSGPMPLTAGIEVPVLNFVRGYGPPKVHSVNLYSSANIGINNSDVRAHIRFGVGAMRGDFMADWFNGSQFSLVCDSVRITALSYAPNLHSAYDPTDGNVMIAASIAQGSVSTYPLTYSEQAISIADGFSTDYYTIPAYAKALMVHSWNNDDPTVATNILIELKAGGPIAGISNVQYDMRVFAANPNGILLPNGMYRMRVRNLSASLATVRIQWILAL